MRVSTDTSLLDLAPGSQADVTLDIVNTGTVIEGVSARIIGLPGENVVSHPPVLPLFPDSSGQMTLNIGLPATFPAGTHPLTVEVHTRDLAAEPAYVDLDLVVPRRPDLRLTPTPRILRARRNGRFVLSLVNSGNTPLDVTLRGSDPERVVDVRFSPESIRVPAGTSVDVLINVRGPRMILGSETDRPFTVEALGRPLGTGPVPVREPVVTPLTPDPAVLPPVPPDPRVLPPVPDPTAEPQPVTDENLTSTTSLIYRQRPWFTRGLLTALILLAIIALWAGVFLLGINSVFSQDPLTKTAPASFFAGSSAGVTPGTPGTADAPAAGAAPAGAMPKTGAMPAGLGGTLAGTVTATSNGEPVGRILVEAWRQDREGAWYVAASAATQADGTFAVAGLVPTEYRVKFSAEGFDPIFYGGVPVLEGSTPAPARAGEITPRIDVVITGHPASISGTTDPGDTLDQVVSRVEVRRPRSAEPLAVVTAVDTRSDGSYTIPDLPAPDTYELTFIAPGYLPTTSVVSVEGGASRINPEVLLGSSFGAIRGLVTDGVNPLGGVTVTTTVDGTEITTGTPTTGEVGTFVLADLPTPSTYVLTFSAEGYATTSRVVGLGPGVQQQDLAVAMTGGTGTVTGRLIDPQGNGLGGAIVTVGGAVDAPSTVTVTAGDVGSFLLTGLASPGSYTLTFSLPGYADQTVPVVLEADTAPAPVSAVMATSYGRISGVVTERNGDPVVGASVVASDGRKLYPVFSTAAANGAEAGSFTIADLPAGVYTVTASRMTPDGPALTGVTAVLTVGPGAALTQDFALPPPDTSGREG